MKRTIEERSAYAKVIARAWADEEFKKKLLADSAAVLKENGIEMPEGVTLKFIEVEEPKENEILMPISARPPEAVDVPDGDLHKIAAGMLEFPINQNGQWTGT